MTTSEGVIEEKRTDPVCGMKVLPSKARATAEHGGETFYFCCEGCRDLFVAEPAKYLGAGDAKACCHHEHGHEKKAPVDAPKDAIYTCPMHPEVRQVGPGDCP
ncbi:MAG: YHS domain-containing protein, partial [Planctomycetota bacterium]